MSYYDKLFLSFKKLNPGTRYFINQIFNKKQCVFMEEAISLLQKINEKEEEVKLLSKEQMQEKTQQIKKKLLETDADENSLLIESFALVREVARRTLNMRHFDVQILGGIVLQRGNIAEMTTGEGKTLVATLPLFFNSLKGQGCHLVTVNDYLAKRDTQWMGPIFHYLGLSVGCIISYKEAKGPSSATAFIFDPTYLPADSRFLNLRPATRQEAYNSDITYGVGNEFGFDYLRDNMAINTNSQVQRDLYFAIIDEVDSILIDEARTPLIISGPSEEAPQLYYEIDRLVRKLNRDTDYTIDEEGQTASLTDQGIQKCERLMSIQNLYDGTNTERVHHINQALRAHTFFKRDKEYIVKDGQVIIVDEFTGRIMPGRRWSDGLHQAIEAKEGVKTESENQTLATVSFQNYFKLYDKIAGMTGTALTESVEFKEIYKVDVIAIPTNKELQREKGDDEIYSTERDKFNAIVASIEEIHQQERPVLVGTISIEKAEVLSRFLKRKNIPHQVLHGKNHEAEAAIIAQAGRPKAVTIATQMAGRGVDIILGGNPEILAREDTIKAIWEKKKTTRSSDNNSGKAFASILIEIENKYKTELSDIENKFKAPLENAKTSLDEKGVIFDKIEKKAYEKFEETIFQKHGGDTYNRYKDRLKQLKEKHDNASEALSIAQQEIKEDSSKLKDFRENAGRTYREYSSLRTNLQTRFNITSYDDVEELRNNFTEVLNSSQEKEEEYKKNLISSTLLFKKGLEDYSQTIKIAFVDIINQINSSTWKKKFSAYIDLLEKFSQQVNSEKERLKTVVESFIKKESQLYYALLEAKENIEREIKASLIEEDYHLALKEHKEAKEKYDKQLTPYNEALTNARTTYEEERSAYEEEWQKAREELEKTPEEFSGIYEQLLEEHKKPWLESHQKVISAGGLHVIGSERYEARRIDNQLTGRAGRQGDPGSSHFFLSIEDDLLRIFGSERMSGIMGKLPEGETIKHPLINKMINNAQKKVEARNFEIRKQLLEFDDVLNEQRQIIYSLRQDILEKKNIDGYITDFLKETVTNLIEESIDLTQKPLQWNLENVKVSLLNLFGLQIVMPPPEDITNPVFWRDNLLENLIKQLQGIYTTKISELGEQVREIQKLIMLQVIDNRWKSHLKVIDELREGINLRAYAQRDPLIAYKHEGYQAFQEMLSSMKTEMLSYLFKIQISEISPTHKDKKTRAPQQVVYTHQTLEQFDTTETDNPQKQDTNIPLQSSSSPTQLISGPEDMPFVREEKKVGRNAPCPCGSGKKYKRCCGKEI